MTGETASSRAVDAFDANARDVLRLYLLVTSVGALLYLASTAFVGPETLLYNLLIVGLLAVNGVSYLLYRRGRTAAAGTVLIVTMWAVGVYPTLAEGLSSTAAINYLLVTVTAGVVVSGRAALVCGVASAALILLVALGEGAGWLDPVPRDVPVITSAIGRALQVGVVAIFLWMTARNLRRSIQRLNESRRRAEQNEERVAELVRESPEGMITLDLDGTVRSANPAACEMLGLGEEEVVGRAIRSLLGEPGGDPWTELFEGSAPARLELRRGEGADAALLEVSPRVAVRADGKPIVHATLRDVTAERRREAERQALQEQLMRTDRLDSVGRLAGGMAHDFNNLLTAIAATAELVAPSVHGDEARKDVAEISALCVRGSDLTRQLLSFARPQALETTRLDLGALVEQLCPMLERLLSERVTLEVETESVWVEASRAQLERVVVNLVVNAQDAMPRGGVVRVGVRGQDDVRALLSVRDEGVGMDEETQTRIFDPFFTTKGSRGTGLGLSIVHGLVTSLGGVVSVDSTPGEGTSFLIDLPAVEAAPEMRARFPSGTTRVRADKVRLLVLEDQPEVRRTTKRLLTREGYDVITAADAEEARARLLDDETIALVVSDVVLPGQSGPELAREMRALRPDVWFVFVSGYTGETLDGEIIADLGAPFLSKPFTRDALITQVTRALASRQVGPSTSLDRGSTVVS
ncbi:MAG: ATP-binding protein [Sandaracinaceae bacterium]